MPMIEKDKSSRRCELRLRVEAATTSPLQDHQNPAAKIFAAGRAAKRRASVPTASAHDLMHPIKLPCLPVLLHVMTYVWTAAGNEELLARVCSPEEQSVKQIAEGTLAVLHAHTHTAHSSILPWSSADYRPPCCKFLVQNYTVLGR